MVIAHNGKCANRLAAPMGAPSVYAQLRRLKLSANWVLLVAFAAPVPVPGGMEGALIQGSPVLSWAANNTAKLGLDAGGAGGGGGECWTLVSTQQFGRDNKVPQVCAAGRPARAVVPHVRWMGAPHLVRFSLAASLAPRWAGR